MSKNHASKVAVSIRVRPLNAREKAAPACYEHFKRSAKTTLTEYTPNGQPRPKTTCEFDHVFSPEDTTDDLFDSVAKPVVDSALEGVNGTIFAYGQTSSGKTFTMNGDEKMDFPGILPLSALHIFDKIEHCSREYLVRVSFVEIYNEIVTDLLNPGAGQIKIRESRERGVFVESTETIVRDVDDLTNVFIKGSKSRHVGSTSMNERSSRSHTIFRITIESKNVGTTGENDAENDDNDDNRRSSTSSTTSNGDDIAGAVLVSTLSLVDLAGSENVRNTGAKGVRLREGGNINKSLLTLSGVIQTLSKNQGLKSGGHVRFRDSKLTRLLQPSLVGNCRTSVICCITPSAEHAEETRSTLRFAASAKTLTTQTKVNEVLNDAAMIRRLKKELHALKRGAKDAAASHSAHDSSSSATTKDMKELEDFNKKIQEENDLLRSKEERMQEICRFFIGNQSTSHRSKNKFRNGRNKKRRETWNPSEIKKLTSSSNIGLTMMGAVNESMNESVDTSVDESCDLSMMDSSMDEMDPRDTNKGNSRQNHTIDIASLNFGNINGRKNSGRFSFDSNGECGGSMQDERRKLLHNARRRVSFGGAMNTSVSSLHSEVIKAKGAKISSQEQKLSELTKELEAMEKKCLEYEKKAEEEAFLCKQAKAVTEEHQNTINTMKSTVTEHEQTISVLRDERDVAVTETQEMNKKLISLKNNNNDIINQMSSNEKELNQLKAKESEWKIENEKNVQKMKENSSTVTALEKTIQELQATIRTNNDSYKLTQAKQIHEKSIEADATIQEQKEMVDNLQEMMIAMEMKMDKVKTELQETKDKLSVSEKQLVKYQHNESIVFNDSKNKMKEIDELRKELKLNLTQAREEATYEIQQAKERAQKQMDEKSSTNQEQIIELQKKIVTLNADKKGIQDMCDALMHKLDLKNSAIRTLQEEKEHLNKKMKASIDEAVENAIAVTKEESKVAKDEYMKNEINKAVDHAVKEAQCKAKDEMEKSITSLKENYNVLKKQLVNEHEVSVEELKTKNEAMVTELTELKKDHAAQMKQMKTKNNELVDSMALMKIEKEDQGDEDNQLYIEMRGKYEEVNEKLTSLKKEKEAMKVLYDTNEENYNHAIEKKEKDISMLTNENEGLKDNIVTLQKELKKAEEMQQNMQKESDKNVNQFDAFKQSIHALEKKISILKEEIDNKNMQLERKSDKISEMESNIETLESKNKDFIIKEKQFEDRSLAINKEKLQLEKEKETLLTNMKALQREYDDVKENWSDNTNTMNELNEKKKELEKALSSLIKNEKTVEAMQSMVSRKNDKIQELENSSAIIEEENKKLLSKINIIETNLTNATKGIAERNDQINQMNTKCDEMFDDIEVKEKTISEIMAKLVREKELNDNQSKELKELKELKERVVYLENRKMTEAHITKFSKIAETNKKLKILNNKLKSKCVELHKKVEEFNTEEAKEGMASNTTTGTMSSREKQKFEKLKSNYKDMKAKLQEYYNKVKANEKEQKQMINMMKKVPDMKENTKRDTKFIEYVEKLIEFHNELNEISSEESKTIDILERRVESLQKKRNEDLLLMEKGCSNNERNIKRLKDENALICKELSECQDLIVDYKKQLQNLTETNKRINKQNSSRISYLEKENLDLMVIKKKLEKNLKKIKSSTNGSTASNATATNSTLRASTRSSTRKPTRKPNKKDKVIINDENVDKENVTIENDEKINAKKHPSPTTSNELNGEDTVLLNELMADAGISDVDDDDDDDEENPSCATQ